MLLLNYDFYDIYAVLLSFRNDPSNTFNEKIAKTIKALLESPQVDNVIESNIIRRSIAEIENLDIEQLAWIQVNNVYTYGQKVIKEKVPSLPIGLEFLCYSHRSAFSTLTYLSGCCVVIGAVPHTLFMDTFIIV